MAIKPFEQVYPGQNPVYRKPKKDVDPKEWERKQRLKEYRIAARREKRNRKSDEKKQRKLNATILRRMVRLLSRLYEEYLTDCPNFMLDEKPYKVQQECRPEQTTSY
jgi:hypothetical protein